MKNPTVVSLSQIFGCSTAATGGGRYFFGRLSAAVLVERAYWNAAIAISAVVTGSKRTDYSRRTL